MLEKLMKLKQAKEKGPMPEPEKKAKMDVMKNLSEMAGSAMKDKLKGLKKVSVSSDSKEGLEAGLEKAQEMVEDGAPEGFPKEEGEMEAEESGEEDKEAEMMEMMKNMSVEELDKHIKMCEDLKRSKSYDSEEPLL
jgi:hypothetical protein